MENSQNQMHLVVSIFQKNILLCLKGQAQEIFGSEIFGDQVQTWSVVINVFLILQKLMDVYTQRLCIFVQWIQAGKRVAKKLYEKIWKYENFICIDPGIQELNFVYPVSSRDIAFRERKIFNFWKFAWHFNVQNNYFVSYFTKS